MEKYNVSKEVDALREALRNDEGYYIAWQANIAMAFYDEYIRATNGGAIIGIDLHKVSNNAAQNFLNLLIGPKDEG
jgi:hypothetical protein